MEIPEEEIPNILTEFEKTVVVPEVNTRTSPALVCTVGLIGSGKTTVTKQLASELGFVWVSADELRRILKQKGYGWGQVLDLTIEIIKKFLAQNYGVINDSDAASKIEAIQDFVKGSDISLAWIRVEAPEEVILERIRIRDTNVADPDMMSENYFMRKPFHENLSVPFSYSFDTSKENFNEQIKEAVQCIENTLNT